MKTKYGIIGLMVSLFIATATAAPKPEKKLYVPMDYSTCGYRASETAIPDVPNMVFVKVAEGDCTDRIQRAIDYVATLKANADGQRGAVLLGEGTFHIDRPLRITASGIVIRGMGKGATTLVKQGFDRGAMVYFEGQDQLKIGDSIDITGKKTLAGSTQLTLASTQGISVGDRIRITRPSTIEWIHSLKMNGFGGGLDGSGWKPTDIIIAWNRVVTAVSGNQITIDAPITTTLSSEFGNGYVNKGRNEGEISECGIENLTMLSAKNNWNPKDEDHCWDAIRMDHVRDCWVRRVDFKYFSGSAVNIQLDCSRITVEDCIASEPVSEVGGWRRSVFLTRGQQTLVQRCVSRNGIHDFVAGACAAGPNAFVQCDSEESLGFSGSIGSWAAGLLFDIVNIDGHDIHLGNLEQWMQGTGWNTANSMLWQCTASTLWCYSPDPDNRCGANGCWGTLTGNAEWLGSNNHVHPRSLFYAQLEQRLKDKNIETAQAVKPFILPRDLEGTTSPTVEQAMRMAHVSLTQPRLTMEMWLDSIPYTASTNPLGIKSIDDVKKVNAKATKQQTHDFTVENGHLTMNHLLMTGNQYDIPWWSGSVKESFTKRGARPAITRFVPGREGTGWTDRIDSVINFMDKHHFVALDHHYGLWYDIRRTDHERVRRADGDVGAPFYEQPFSRSGKGTAWDGLSRYDLNKPNEWYWQRLNEFAQKGNPKGILLFNQHYFQHNILEAGAHWVDCPWRPVNNINGTNFPEPVPFTGDKRVFMAEQFYDVDNPVLRPLHRQYIRMCLDLLKDQPNVVHMISAEYTGPLHFTRFWLQTIAEWEAETGRHPLIALSCTKDAQDALLEDTVLNKVVDIIDIRYWHYNTKEAWAPEAGKNMAPRQWMRKWGAGKTGFNEAYKAVREYREKYPDKAVTFYAQQYPTYGWAILMAGGSLPNVIIKNSKLQSDLCKMKAIDGTGCVALGDKDTGYVVYAKSSSVSIPVQAGKYNVYTVNTRTGETKISMKSAKINDTYTVADTTEGTVYWLEKQ